MLNNHLKQAHMDELERQAGILGLNDIDRREIGRMADRIVHGDYQTLPFYGYTEGEIAQAADYILTGNDATANKDKISELVDRAFV